MSVERGRGKRACGPAFRGSPKPPRRPRHRRDGAHLPHRRRQDQEGRREGARRADLQARVRRRGRRLFDDGARVHGAVPALQGGVRHDRALHGEELPGRGQADLPGPRSNPAGRAHQRRHRPVDGGHDRRGLCAQDRSQAVQAAQAGAQVGRGAGSSHQERVRLLQAAQTREDADKRALPRGQKPHAGARARGDRPAARAGDRARAHYRHEARRGMRATLERPQRRRQHHRVARARQRRGRLLPQGAEDGQLGQDDPPHEEHLREAAGMAQGGRSSGPASSATASATRSSWAPRSPTAAHTTPRCSARTSPPSAR